MRTLFAAALVLSLSACFGGGGEPLSSTATKRAPHSNVNLGNTNVSQTPTHSDDPRAQAVIDIRVATQNASDAAYRSAAAGVAHDVFSAQQAAVDLANAATVVQQRAATIASIDGSSGGEDCGCGGCSGEPAVTDPVVQDAVQVTALAAEVGGSVADDLSPPSETQCSQVCGCEGCSESCQEVPGPVDETQLGTDVNDATNAGDLAQDASDNLVIG